MALTALLSTTSHVATTLAYKRADITVVDPMIFFRMVIDAVFGFVLYSEVPDLWTWIGSVVILIAGII